MEGHRPDFIMMSYQSLPSIFSWAAVVDAEFIKSSGAPYRQLIAEKKLPTQKRQAYGLLYEKLDKKFLSKPCIDVMVEEHEGVVAVPINFYGKLDAFDRYGLNMCIWKVGGHYERAVSDPQTHRSDQERLNKWLTKNNIKLIDEIDSVLSAFDRVKLQTDLKNFMKRQPWRVRWNFDVPRYVVLNNLQAVPVDQRLEEYKAKAYAAGLNFPVLFKIKTGQVAKDAHIFFCVNNEAGMREALSYPGYTGDVLIQAYVPHYEQVYKVYGCGDFAQAYIRKSLPHAEITSKNAYKFDSHSKFDDTLYTEFHPTHMRVD